MSQVFRQGQWLDPAVHDPTQAYSSAGRFTLIGGVSRFDRHHHDVDELWMICTGRGIVEVDGTTYEVGPGDILHTLAGESHDFVAVSGLLMGFFVESPVSPGGVTGHIHGSEADAAGHVVALLPDADTSKADA